MPYKTKSQAVKMTKYVDPETQEMYNTAKEANEAIAIREFTFELSSLFMSYLELTDYIKEDDLYYIAKEIAGSDLGLKLHQALGRYFS
jgi:hypothetical protein